MKTKRRTEAGCALRGVLETIVIQVRPSARSTWTLLAAWRVFITPRILICVLIVAVVGITATWLLDRQSLANHYQSREENIRTSSRVLSAAESNYIAAHYFRQTPDNFGDFFTKRLLKDVLTIYTFRSEIIESGEQPELAVRMTLKALDCKSADEFLALGDGVEFNDTVGDLVLKSTFANQQSRDGLAEFIDNSILPNP